MALTVPQPQLSQKDATGNQLAAEQPVTLTCEPVTFPDGTLLVAENALEFGFLLYRIQGGGVTEVWDEAGQEWLLESVTLPAPQTLFRQNEQWQSIIVAMGQKDQSGQDKFVERSGGFPQYFVRCFFRGKDAQGEEHSGESPSSQVVEILGLGEKDRAGLKMEPESPAKAREIRLFLKDEALTLERGTIAIREEAGKVVVELSANGATLTLDRQGDILLTPAPGRKVMISAPLEAEQIRYQPADAAGNSIGSKRWLT